MQSVPGLIENLSLEASRGLVEEADEYIATIVVDEVDAGNIAKATSADVSGLTSTTGPCIIRRCIPSIIR